VGGMSPLRRDGHTRDGITHHKVLLTHERRRRRWSSTGSSFSYTPSLSSPCTSFDIGVSKTSQILSRVVTVIGRPASTCCQWRVEKPKESISSCEKPRFLRSPFNLMPKARKKCS